MFIMYYCNLCSQTQGVFLRSFQGNPQIVNSLSVISIKGSFLVNIIDYQIQVPIVVQITISHPIGKSFSIQLPFLSYFFKGIPSFVFINIIRQGFTFIICDLKIKGLSKGSGIAPIIYIVIINIPFCTISNIYILPAIIVQVGKECGPAPIGRGHFGKSGYFTHDRNILGIYSII